MNAAPMDEGVKDYPIGKLRWLIVNEIEGAAWPEAAALRRLWPI